jgi:hypothetical protein
VLLLTSRDRGPSRTHASRTRGREQALGDEPRLLPETVLTADSVVLGPAEVLRRARSHDLTNRPASSVKTARLKRYSALLNEAATHLAVHSAASSSPHERQKP